MSSITKIKHVAELWRLCLGSNFSTSSSTRMRWSLLYVCNTHNIFMKIGTNEHMSAVYVVLNRRRRKDCRWGISGWKADRQSNQQIESSTGDKQVGKHESSVSVKPELDRDKRKGKVESSAAVEPKATWTGISKTKADRQSISSPYRSFQRSKRRHTIGGSWAIWEASSTLLGRSADAPGRP